MNTTTSGTKEGGNLSFTSARYCRRFSLADIQVATEDFKHFLGKGAFGEVYKGRIDDGQQTVAIKRLAPNSKQSEGQFVAEIKTLSKLHHKNVVSLIGYCKENGNMFLVYDYMPHGSLDNHIYIDSSTPLAWDERLKICIGAGLGIQYLQSGTTITHRDIKPANILLDENLIAKVSDFGLAKHLGTSNSNSNDGTWKGSFGFVAPEYANAGELTENSDTHGFGVLLLEVLSGRLATDRTLDERGIVMWAQEKISKGIAHEIVAPNLKISPDCLKTYVEIAIKCVDRDPKNRPTMTQVVAQLEVALTKQERKVTSRCLRLRNKLMLLVSTQKVHARADITVPATQEAVEDERMVNMLPVAVPAIAIDELPDQLTVDVGTIVVPAIPIKELKEITNNFSPRHLICREFNQNVYHGTLQSGQLAAIKRLKNDGQQEPKFIAQVLIHSSLKHENVVRPLGYCVNGGWQFLAYEFADGSLHDCLYGQGINGSNPVPALSWGQRVNIAMCTAKGLEYIHEKSQIHCNIKSTNILLYDDYKVAKLVDFGLSTQATRDVHGYYHPLGLSMLRDYHPPEYDRGSGKLSSKSDVYSFGVVLLQLLTGGYLIDPTRPTGQHHIVDWANTWLSSRGKKHVDASLRGDYPPQAVAKMFRVAASCVQCNSECRPDMSVVVRYLNILAEQPAH